MNNFTKGIAVTLFFLLIILVLIGAKFGASSQASSIACSQDGRFIYLSDGGDVYKSDNFGESWITITPDSKKGNLK